MTISIGTLLLILALCMAIPILFFESDAFLFCKRLYLKKKTEKNRKKRKDRRARELAQYEKRDLR